jgi:DNA invertase Pin-like site-specific DNA recombinase
MKAAIYARVSTDDQDPENQVSQLKDYANRMGYDIHDVYVDKGESGLKDNRPAFNEMLKAMRLRMFDLVLVWKLDRIGRSLQHLLQILQEMQNKNIGFCCLTQNIDTTTAAGKLMFHIIGAFAEFESSLISERTKAGMLRAKLAGKHVGRPRKNKKLF